MGKEQYYFDSNLYFSIPKQLSTIIPRYKFLLKQSMSLLTRNLKEQISWYDKINFFGHNFKKYGDILLFMVLAQPFTGSWDSYGFQREVDDIIDGDKLLDEISIPDFINRLKEVLQNPNLVTSPLEYILISSLFSLRKKLRKDESLTYPQQLYMQFLDAMLVEYKRRESGIIYNQEILNTIQRNSFFSSIEIMLIGMGSKQRIGDIGDLGLLQAKIYSLKDLESDIGNNIFNIPQELLDEINISQDNIKNDIASFVSYDAVKQRMQQELQGCIDISSAIQKNQKGKERDKRTLLVVNYIIGSWIKKDIPVIREKYNLSFESGY